MLNKALEYIIQNLSEKIIILNAYSRSEKHKKYELLNERIETLYIRGIDKKIRAIFKFRELRMFGFRIFRSSVMLVHIAVIYVC